MGEWWGERGGGSGWCRRVESGWGSGWGGGGGALWGLDGGLQTVQGASRTGGGSGFTGVGGQVDATVDGVVVLVGRGRLAGVLPARRVLLHVCVVDEGDVGRGVLYPKLGVRHEVVDGGSGFGLFQSFIKGAAECIHDTDLDKKTKWRTK